MNIKISKAIAEYLGETKMRVLGQELRSNSYRDHFIVGLAGLPQPQIRQLREWLDDMVKMGIRGPKTLIKDIDTWQEAIRGGKAVKARTLNQFAAVLTEYLRPVPGHRVYQRLDLDGLAHKAFYCNKVVYHPPERLQGHIYPAFVELNLMYIEFDGQMSMKIELKAEDARGYTPVEALVRKGLFPETDELRAGYLAETDRFNDIALNVGQQFYAIGTATDDMDGNDTAGGARWSSYHGRASMQMIRDERPSKVVIDVFYESEKERRNRQTAYIDTHFWQRSQPSIEDLDGENLEFDEDMDELEVTDTRDTSLGEAAEIPVHPFCAVFDLKRHLRMRIHVNYLADYAYNSKMSDNLILPDVTKNLVATLIQQSHVKFADIIEGKAGGICVLLTGAPGVGKTLTAEVFAEASKRPLYSIQAAQLGIKADNVETNLMKFLSRGSRWNAVVLIDEADVYIRSRDKDMEHNAIVASFLRVLEYQTSVLFMTTNLAESVDDAIASRCVARIDYQTPTFDQQKEIWRVLNQVNNAGLTPQNIRVIAKAHPNLTGRDIKQLIKLAGLVAANHKQKIQPSTIDFVAQFQPTRQRDATSASSGWEGLLSV